MAERVVGLDIGTHSVRVADVDPGPRPVLRGFWQADLPPNAVRNGEVADAAAAADTIRRLWREAGLRQRPARVGVASERVVVRTIELPDLSDAELAGALQFEAENYVPFPADETVLDFHVLERVRGPDGEPTARILLAAAHRETVGALLSAVKAAGVRAIGVDLVPLALIRGLRPAPAEAGGAEALVSVGGGVTTLVVHEAGVPRLVRIVGTGADAVTDAVARQLAVAPEAAEAAIREFRAGGDPAVGAALEAGLGMVTGPIHGSLDYYLSQADSALLTRVLLTGGGSLVPGLVDSLSASLALPVEHARPREAIDVAGVAVPEDQLPSLDPYLPVATGLALGGSRIGGVQIDLLPPEARREAAGRRATRRAALVAGGLFVILAGLSLVQAMGNDDRRDRLATQRRANAVVQAQVDDLAGPLQLEADLTAARRQATAALAGDIAWSRVLEDLAATVPEEVWLSGFSLQLTMADQPATAGEAPDPGAAPAPASETPIGTATFAATALDFPSVAAWLHRLPRLPYLLNLSVSSATKSEGGARPVVSFTSSATVGPAARSDRLARILGPGP